GSVADPCTSVDQQFGNGECFINTGQFLGNLWLAAAWTAFAWLGYGLLMREDVASRARQGLNFRGLAFAVVVALVGMQRGAEVVLRSLLGAPERFQDLGGSQSAYFAAIDRFNFVAPLAFGVVVAGSYLLWLASDSRRGGPLDIVAMGQTAL